LINIHKKLFIFIVFLISLPIICQQAWADSVPLPPSGVSATDGQYTDKVVVTWNSVSGATQYQVYRSESQEGANIIVCPWQGATNCDDVTASGNITYYYRVKAKNISGEGDYSSFDTGYTSCSSQAVPGGVSASDGTYSDKVEVTWNSVAGATQYQVYRSESSGGAKTVICVWQAGTTCDDTTAVTGITYYYKVKAKNNCRSESDYSSSDTGFRCPSQAAPGGISASDGTYSDKIRVTWISVTGATEYQVYREEPFGGGTTEVICSWQGATSCDDMTASGGITYYYWLKAKNSCGSESDFSTYNTGYTSCPSQAAPGGLSASDGTYPDKVEVTWNSVAGATQYQAYRSESSGGAKTVICVWQAGTICNDTTAVTGTMYYYWVKAKNNCRSESLYSSSDTGFTCPVLYPPNLISPSHGATIVSATPILDWSDVSEASSYDVQVCTDNVCSSVVVSQNTGGSQFTITQALKRNTQYWWRVRSRNSCGPGLWSTVRNFTTENTILLLWRHQVSGDIVLWKMNNVNLLQQSYVWKQGDENWKIVNYIDFNNDGMPDILWQNQISGDIYIMFMDEASIEGGCSAGGVSDPLWRLASAADFNADGSPDYLWQHLASGDLYTWYMHWADEYGCVVVSGGSSSGGVNDVNWKIAETADFNADGSPDYLWQHQLRGDLYIWFMDGIASIHGVSVPGEEDINWKVAGAADFNGDGRQDILWHNHATGDILVWLMDGALKIGESALIPDSRVEDTGWKIVGCW
jgi:fibronectin type 3 domain-containing protein